MRRRELLTGTAALTGAAAIGLAAPVRPAPPARPAAALDDVLYGRAHAAPVPLADLRAFCDAVRDDFRAARYERLPASLPGLIAAAQAASSDAGAAERAAASTLLARPTSSPPTSP